MLVCILALPDLFGKAMADDNMVRLAAPGPWPAISELIAFDNRIWFANGEPFRNFNAADIYSFDPATGGSRYEHGLFSQGAGKPAVVEGHLYWPYEDPRSNAGLGEYEVTDGTHWQRNSFTEGNALHVHAIKSCGGLLTAGTGGWEGALQQSTDEGATWQEIYRIPEVQGQLSRITDLVEHNGHCLFAVTAWEQPGQRLFELDKNGVKAIDAWPVGERVSALTSFHGALYAAHEGLGTRQFLRYDGKAVTPVILPRSGTVQDVDASDDLIAVATSDAGGGNIFVSSDGQDWHLLQRIEQELPVDILVVGKQVYVGTHGSNRGSLWGPKEPLPATPAAVPLAPVTEQPLSDETLDAALRTLNSALSPKPDYTSYQSGIISILLPLALTHSDAAGLHLSKRARRDLPSGSLMTFTQQPYSYEALARWFLLYGAGLSGKGRVELSWLGEAWTAVPRSSEKYFETSVAAIWAVGFMHQSNRETIDALIERLARSGEPAWLKGDVVAALTCVTDQRFGHDLKSWIAWWTKARADWPPAQ